ncbi:hypothetical protein GOB94_09050 [Granulicella sp. 5B5]|uniref:hypothetical protein n=1 Tax=Granulicella sp. 5B5 TaxID=1617967 RepID=UPI0015F5742C|nr:hypothetical protein [Granulicella sp. 5B5]QMV18811.1 hypothetical protein GOB94_09050 [Granulicella sp. 5B5]
MASNNLILRWWRQLRFDVPRMREHAPSRGRVGVVVLSIATVAGVVVLIFGPMGWFEHRYGGGWWGIGTVVLMYALALTVRRWMKRRNETTTLSLARATAPSQREGMLARRKIVATMVSRAAREVGLHAGVATDAPVGAVRAAQLQRLRAEGLWESVPTSLQAMLAAPEGSWNTETTGRVLVHLEVIVVLNWILKESYELPSLSRGGAVDGEMLREALIGKADRGSYLRTEAEIARQEGPTRVYLARLQNELVKRGATEGEVDEEMEKYAGQYMMYAASVGEAEVVAEDLPLKGGLIRDAPTADLLHLRGVAAVRMVTLAATRDVLMGLGLERMDEVVEGIIDVNTLIFYATI